MINLLLRFYEELNDFLPLEKRKMSFNYAVAPHTAIKDVIESVGVPHTEIDLILVNQQSVDFTYQVKEGDYISVYPVFEAIDIKEIVHLHPEPLRNTQFILDVHLGKLARYLRLLGYDVAYSTHLSDSEIIERSQKEKRIILTRDVGLLKNKSVTHGYWIRHIEINKQVTEVLERFDLFRQCKPFTRCMECNGILDNVDKKDIVPDLSERILKSYQDFKRCNQCKKIYWQGTHYNKLKKWVLQICK